MALLVHAIIRAEDASAVPPLPPGTQVVTEPDVGAVISPVQDPVEEQDAGPHLELLSQLSTAIPALPLTFATVAPDEQTVRTDVLRPAASTLRQQVEALTDHVEVRIGVRFDEEASLATVAAADDEGLRQLRQASQQSGGIAARMALGEEIARRMRDAHGAAFWELVAPARDLADRLTVIEGDEQQLWAALLLQRDRLPAMDATVAAMRAAALGEADIEYVGPLPPLTFLPELLDESQTSRDDPSPWGW
jgi:hypothetical protein